MEPLVAYLVRARGLALSDSGLGLVGDISDSGVNFADYGSTHNLYAAFDLTLPVTTAP